MGWPGEKGQWELSGVYQLFTEAGQTRDRESSHHITFRSCSPHRAHFKGEGKGRNRAALLGKRSVDKQGKCVILTHAKAGGYLPAHLQGLCSDGTAWYTLPTWSRAPLHSGYYWGIYCLSCLPSSLRNTFLP